MSYSTPFETKPGNGSFFAVKEKKNERGPDYTGKLKWMDGKEYYVSVWKKTSSKGGGFYSMAIGNEVQAPQPVYSAAHDIAKSNGYQPQPAGLDDDVPF